MWRNATNEGFDSTQCDGKTVRSAKRKEEIYYRKKKKKKKKKKGGGGGGERKSNNKKANQDKNTNASLQSLVLTTGCMCVCDIACSGLRSRSFPGCTILQFLQ